MKKLSVFFLLFCVLFFSGCIVKNDIQTTSDVNKDYIIYNLGKLPKNLTSLNSDNVRDNDLWLAIFEGLVKTDLKGNIIPGLAGSWETSKDGLIYKFKIKDNASWSDGNSITAQDFSDFFKSILKDTTNTDYSKELYSIFGAKDYSNGKKAFNGVAINVIDTQDIEFRLNSPDNNFLNTLSQPYFSLRVINSDLANWTGSFKQINYTGPFKIDNVSKNGVVSLVKNNSYWDRNNVLLHKLIFTSIDSCEEALANFETKKIDVMVDPPLSEAKRLMESDEAYTSPTNVLNSFIFNLNSKGISNNLKFRKAVNLAISTAKSEIVKNSLNDIGKAAVTFVPSLDVNKDRTEGANSRPGSNANVDLKENSADDISKAKTLIKESEYNKQSLKLIYLDSTENERICQAFKKSIHDLLGINVNCTGYNYDNLREIIQSGNYDILKTENNNFFSDEKSFLQMWKSSSSFNINGYKNFQYDTILNKIDNEKDKNKRDKYTQSAESILNNDLPEIPFYYSDLVICKNDNVTGIEVTNKGNLIFNKAIYKN